MCYFHKFHSLNVVFCFYSYLLAPIEESPTIIPQFTQPETPKHPQVQPPQPQQLPAPSPISGSVTTQFHRITFGGRFHDGGNQEPGSADLPTFFAQLNPTYGKEPASKTLPKKGNLISILY